LLEISRRFCSTGGNSFRKLTLTPMPALQSTRRFRYAQAMAVRGSVEDFSKADPDPDPN